MAGHSLLWFEIAVADFERARAFYEAILEAELDVHDMGETLMGLFPVGEGGIGGAIQYDPTSRPSENGTIVYLDAGEDLAPMLARVEAGGGTIVLGKTKIPGDYGYFALFNDVEGNRVGLMSAS